MNDLLVDPLFSVETFSGIRHLSLPGLLAALGEDQVLSYPALRRHQQDPFHVFLCQLATASLARAGETSPVQPETFWREALLGLADGQSSAWQLVVDDPMLPAFMQPPSPSKTDFADAFKPKAATPDELDVLATAKDHDVKIARVNPAVEELWTYALITLQTTAGFFGQGNYGIIRMNGGFASRSIVSLVSDPAPSSRFREETSVALSCRAEMLGTAFNYQSNGVVLTWLKQWNRQQSLYTLSVLDPMFIESARPIRLGNTETGFTAKGASSKSAQIARPDKDNGDTGDPWTVINLADKKKGVSALTLSANGFTPEKLTDILFENGFRLTPLQQTRPTPELSPVVLCASVLVRGQGTTDGYHAVQIPIPRRARLALFSVGSEKESLGKLAKELLRDAGDIERSCLKTALFALCEAGPQGMPDFNAREIGKWVNSLAADFALAWQDNYFPLLWRGADPGADHRALRGEWVRGLAVRARDTLRRAEQRAPIPSSRKLRAAVRAQSLLEAMFHKKGFDEFMKETVHVDSDD